MRTCACATGLLLGECTCGTAAERCERAGRGLLHGCGEGLVELAAVHHAVLRTRRGYASRITLRACQGSIRPRVAEETLLSSMLSKTSSAMLSLRDCSSSITAAIVFDTCPHTTNAPFTYSPAAVQEHGCGSCGGQFHQTVFRSQSHVSACRALCVEGRGTWGR